MPRFDTHRCGCTRRDFMKNTLDCGAHTLLALSCMTVGARKAFGAQARGDVVMESPFARIEKLADGVWAVVSTPSGGDYSTLSNGGIVAGDEATLAIEGFQTAKGCAWVREAARELTGRYPTHVVLTHCHGDHVRGTVGYYGAASNPTLISSTSTRRLLATRYATPAPVRAVGGVRNHGAPIILPGSLVPDDADGGPKPIGGRSRPATLDLGNRRVTLTPRAGHTPSDLTVEVLDPNVTFCGDLYWNGVFPNFMDAMPSTLSTTCKAMLADGGGTFIPGHGSLGGIGELKNYLAVLDAVEAAARASHDKGVTPTEAAKYFSIPESLGQWMLFNQTYFETAIEKWHRELDADAADR